jgi:hypothetical protein
MKFRTCLLSITLLVFASCKKQESSIVVQVIRDPDAPYAESLRNEAHKFSMSTPKVDSGRDVVIATNEGGIPFSQDLPRLLRMRPEMVIVNAPLSLPGNESLTNEMGPPTTVCGGTAYIPSWAEGERREGAEKYLKFLVAHCR